MVAARRLQQEVRHPALDWDRVVKLACENDLGPLLYKRLQQLRPDGRTRGPLAALKAMYCATAIRNTLLYRELETLLRALGTLGAPVIVLKGAALADRVYRDRALRPMSDVDLLVGKERMLDVEDLLGRMGYAVEELKPGDKAWCYERHYHLVFCRQVNASFRMRCEIHWLLERPTRPFTIDTEGVWTRALPASVANTDVLVLSPEDLLLQLCLHTCKHRLVGGFRAFCDIAEVITHSGQNIDWQLVLQRARQWQIDPFVYVPLHLVQRLLGADVPEWVLDALHPEDFDERTLDAAMREVLEDRQSASLFSDFFQIRYGHSLAERAAAIRKAFSHAAIARRYGLAANSMAIYRHYPQRLRDLARDYGFELWRLMRHGDEAVEKADGRARLAKWLEPFGEGGRPP